MPNTYFQFKQFIIHQKNSAMKVTTDSCLFGAWVAKQINLMDTGNSKFLDIGAGTGLLSLMVAQQTTGKIDAIEIDEQTYQEAQENVSLSNWTDRIHLINADVQQFQFPGKYDYILSNPPFYENELNSGNTKKDLAHHDEGLRLPALLNTIDNHLQPEGKFYLLLPYKRFEEFQKLIASTNLAIQSQVLVKQTINHSFFRMMIMGGFKTHEINRSLQSEISIRDNNNEYTPEFSTLLRPYYLK